MKRYINDKGEFAASSMEIDGRMVSNPTEEMLVKAGYHEYVEPAKTLEECKAEKISEIEAYDASDAVDSFTINGQSMWLTVEERQQIATQISANEAVGRDNMTRWFGSHSFTFPLATWKQMLVALEVYAGDAINVTEAHKAAIEALATIEDVEAYDFTANYPPKPVF